MHLTAGFLVSNVQLCVFRQARGRQAWNSCVRNVKDCNGKSVTLMLVRWLSCSDSTAFIYSLYRFFHHGVTHTHIHPFNGPLSGTAQVSRYQRGKTNLDFAEARDSEWQWHQLGHMQVCTSLQTDNHASMAASHHSVICRPDAVPAAQPTASKHWRHSVNN